jgi:hypothetical protein
MGIAPQFGRTSRYVIFGIMAFVVLFTTPLLLVQVFQCKPVTDAWAISDSKYPVDELTIISVTGVFNICGNTFLLVFVILKIWYGECHSLDIFRLTTVGLCGWPWDRNWH